MAPRSQPNWPRIVPWLARGLADARAAGTRRLLFVTYKPIVERLDESPEVAKLVAAWRANGRELELAHYGAVRGLNRWAAFDACLTIGDPWPSKPTAQDTADALGLGNFDTAYIAAARGELAQVHGRLRDVRRTTPAWHGHFGQLAPAGWGPNTVVITFPLGRPPAEQAPGVQERFRSYVARVGGVRAAARTLGVAAGTVGDWQSGRRAIPRRISDRLLAELPRDDGVFAEVPSEEKTTSIGSSANTPAVVTAPPTAPVESEPQPSQPPQVPSERTGQRLHACGLAKPEQPTETCDVEVA